MIFKALKSCDGFTYIAALLLVVVMGILLGAASQSWTMIMQREREKELLFRGAQIKDAIDKWNKGGAGIRPMPLRDLKDLLKDPRSTSKIRYLRRLYTDPLTNKEWTPITDQAKGIIGVQSTSEDLPIKQDFSDYPADSTEFTMFGEKKKYSEWLFVPDDLQNLVAKLTVQTGPLAQPPTPGHLPVPGQIK